MKRLNNFLCVCAVATAVSTSAANLPSDWQHEQHFSISTTGLVKISLPLATLDAARPALEDLRLYDDAGHEVPYLIERPMPSPKIIQPAKSFSVSLNVNNTVITLETGFSQPLDAVTLETPAMDFIKSVRVEGSADGTRWETLAQGRPIFRQWYGAANLEIPFPPATLKRLRLTVDDWRSSPIPFTGALLHAASSETAPMETVPAIISERDENPGQTRMALNLGAANLSVAGLQIETSEPLFMRQISIAIPQISGSAIREQTIGQGVIYRVAVGGQEPSQNIDVPLESLVPSRELILLLKNGNSPPLPVSAVRVERHPVYLVFLAQPPGTFHLLTGNARCDAPHYDLAGLNMDLKSVAISPAGISPLADNPDFHPPEVLPGLEFAGAMLDTSAWKFRQPVKISAPGAQQIELTAEVLAHSDADFADLRVMRGSNQVPYIVERTSISRPVVPSVTATNEAKSPELSRWILQLPRAGLPVTRLTCVATTPLFQRHLRLYEEVTDERGETYSRDLGEANWIQTPDDKNEEFLVTLDRPPQTSILYLETQNGDNPPIQLEQFKLYYPVTRILLKARPEDKLFLYYGNPDAGPPSYDLTLVANQLLAADKNTASLVGEEQLRKSSWSAKEVPGQGGVLFWGVLALVVVVLLAVISRLLPKSSLPQS